MDEGKHQTFNTTAQKVISNLFSSDVYVVADVLGQILRPSKVTISAEFGLIISERAK